MAATGVGALLYVRRLRVLMSVGLACSSFACRACVWQLLLLQQLTDDALLLLAVLQIQPQRSYLAFAVRLAAVMFASEISWAGSGLGMKAGVCWRVTLSWVCGPIRYVTYAGTCGSWT
jgi:hypothetical protein